MFARDVLDPCHCRVPLPRQLHAPVPAPVPPLHTKNTIPLHHYATTLFYDGSAAQATAKPKAKRKPKASSVTTFTSVAWSDSDSLSEVSGASLGSEASTASISTSAAPAGAFEGALIGAFAHARLQAPERLCYLILPCEYIRCRQPRMMNSRAHRQWCDVATGPDAPPNVTLVIWMVLRHEEFVTPLETLKCQRRGVYCVLIRCRSPVLHHYTTTPSHR